MCPQSMLRTHLDIHVQKKRQTSTQVSPFIAENLQHLAKGNTCLLRLYQCLITALPHKLVEAYVFPCIQDARHWLVVQLGPGQGTLNTVRFNMASMCSPMFNVVFKTKSLCIVAVWQKTTFPVWKEQQSKQRKTKESEEERKDGIFQPCSAWKQQQTSWNIWTHAL